MKKLFFLIFLASCSSSMVTSPTRSQYAPKNYKPTGMIKYLNQGADFVIKSRREDAFKQMHDQCNGDYRITYEGQQEDGGSVSSMGNSTLYNPTHYWYISFECLGGA